MDIQFPAALLRSALVLLSMLSLLTAGMPASAASRSAAASADLPPVEGEVIVKFKPGASVLRQHALAARGASNAAVATVLEQRAAMLGARHGRALMAGPAVGEHMQVVRSSSGMTAAVLAAQLATDADVEFAVPNGRQRILAAPNDPLYAATATGVRPRGPDSGQWYLRAPAGAAVSSIDIEAAWARTLGSPGVVVAVLDTGVRPEHPDLSGRLLPGYDFVNNCLVANDQGAACDPGNGSNPPSRDADPSDPGDWITAAEANRGEFTNCSESDSSWHGTHTAALVGAATNDAVGMAGTAPGVQVLPVRVLGKCFGTDSDIQAGMLWAAGIAVAGVPDNPNPAKVINLSLGGGGSCSASYQSVVNQIVAKGVVVVAAAGNSAGGPVGTPGNCSGVIAVLALRHVGTKVGFSDLGPQIAIAAPGGNCVNTAAGSPCLYPILAATNTGTRGPLASAWTDSYNISVGTSFAAPLVAGVAGLMFSANPTLTPALLRTRMQATARVFPTTGGDNGDGSPVQQCRAPSASVEQLQCYCNTSYCGAGMLDAGAAVAAVAVTTQANAGIVSALPTAGSPVTLSAANSTAVTGATLVGYAWSVVDGGGIVSGFTGASNAATVSLLPSAAGTFTLRLTVTDSAGGSNSSTLAVTVAAAPPTVAPPAATGGGDGGGGGALGSAWVLGLLLAAAAVRAGSRRP